MKFWEAMYCAMLEVSSADNSNTEASTPHLLEKVKTALNKVNQRNGEFRRAFSAQVVDITSNTLTLYEQFKDSIRSMVHMDEIW